MTVETTLGRLVAADPYCLYLGVQLAGADNGAVGALEALPDLVLASDEQHIGNRHTLGMHGGVVAAFLELAARLHVQVASAQPAGALTFTTEFLREVRHGELRARTEIVRRGRRLAVARVTAWTDDRLRPAATGHGSFALGPAE